MGRKSFLFLLLGVICISTLILALFQFDAPTIRCNELIGTPGIKNSKTMCIEIYYEIEAASFLSNIVNLFNVVQEKDYWAMKNVTINNIGNTDFQNFNLSISVKPVGEQYEGASVNEGTVSINVPALNPNESFGVYENEYGLYDTKTNGKIIEQNQFLTNSRIQLYKRGEWLISYDETANLSGFVILNGRPFEKPLVLSTTDTGTVLALIIQLLLVLLSLIAIIVTLYVGYETPKELKKVTNILKKQITEIRNASENQLKQHKEKEREYKKRSIRALISELNANVRVARGILKDKKGYLEFGNIPVTNFVTLSLEKILTERIIESDTIYQDLHSLYSIFDSLNALLSRLRSPLPKGAHKKDIDTICIILTEKRHGKDAKISFVDVTNVLAKKLEKMQ